MYIFYAILLALSGLAGAFFLIKVNEVSKTKEQILICGVLIISLQSIFFAGYTTALATPELLSGFISVFFMMWLAITDAKSHRLPNTIIFAWLLCRTLFVSIGVFAERSVGIIIWSVAGAFIMGVSALTIYIISKKSFGAGDVKLVFAMGFALMLGRAFWTVLCAFILCAIYAGLRIFFRKATVVSHIPLGPFFLAGSMLTFWVGLICRR